jgi:predicted mannosyl-3-phosphoglycerate phosphatase (HAD superfamily)
MDNRIVGIGNRLQEASIANPVEEINEEADDKSRVLQEINEERAALEASRKVLEGLLSKTQERTGITITNVRTSEGGRAATGLINTQGKYANANITIDNIEATKDGKVIAGIADGVNLDNFF